MPPSGILDAFLVSGWRLHTNRSFTGPFLSSHLVAKTTEGQGQSSGCAESRVLCLSTDRLFYHELPGDWVVQDSSMLGIEKPSTHGSCSVVFAAGLALMVYSDREKPSESVEFQGVPEASLLRDLPLC